MLSDIKNRNKRLYKNNSKKLSLSETKNSANNSKSHNTNLLLSHTRKNDEFYTLYSDIKSELNHYTAYFADKTIYCNCDNPAKSNFCKYFHQNFSKLKLNQLIVTYLNLDANEPTYAYIYSGGNDDNICYYNQKQITGNGSFSSPACINLLLKSDVIVTNPPFSLFRQYIHLLNLNQKKFIIVGNQNAITSREAFNLFLNQKIWHGYNKIKSFIKPDGSIQRFGNIVWYTNLSVAKSISVTNFSKKHFTQQDYPVYVNFPAFNVSKVKDIPVNKTINVTVTKNRIREFQFIYQSDFKVRKIDKIKGIAYVSIKHPIYGVPVSFADYYSPISDLNSEEDKGIKTIANKYKIIGIDIKSVAEKIGIKPIGKKWLDLYLNQGNRGHYTANMRNLVLISDKGIVKAPFRRILIREK